MIENDIYNWLSTSGFEFGDENNTSLAFELVNEELEELKYALHTNNTQEIYDACIDLKWVLGNVMYFNSIDLNKLKEYEELVSISNWSKFAKTEQEAINTIEAYRSATHPSKLGTRIDSYYEKVGDYYVIKRHDGKILKSLLYTSVDQLLKKKENAHR